MADDAQQDRIARLFAALEEVPHEQREAFIAGLSHEDRTAILNAEAEASEEVLPEVGELGGEG